MKLKLEKFKEKNNKRKFIIIFTVCCVFLLAGVFLYTSFASFTEDKQFNVINGQYQDPGDLYFAVYIDGQITNTFPGIHDGYTLNESQSSCTNGVTVSWDYLNWHVDLDLSNFYIDDFNKIKCTLYFEQYTPLATEYLVQLSNTTSDELVYDETPDNNLRYVGVDPNNYVWFNDELWRIIGVMNNIENLVSDEESRVKIIRDESIGEYAWTTEPDTDDIDTAHSNWEISTLNSILNGAYHSKTTGEYYDRGNLITVDFTSIGLNNTARSMIGSAVWNLGGVTEQSLINYTAKEWYTAERGNQVAVSTAPGSAYPTDILRTVGLIYPSDYGYATSGGSTVDRNTCLATNLYSWNSVSDCYNNDWLYKQTYYWTITHIINTTDYGIAISSGKVNYYPLTNVRSVFPTVYLSPDVKITGGDGSKDNPFILSL